MIGFFRVLRAKINIFGKIRTDLTVPVFPQRCQTVLSNSATGINTSKCQPLKQRDRLTNLWAVRRQLSDRGSKPNQNNDRLYDIAPELYNVPAQLLQGDAQFQLSQKRNFCTAWFCNFGKLQIFSADHNFIKLSWGLRRPYRPFQHRPTVKAPYVFAWDSLTSSPSRNNCNCLSRLSRHGDILF